LAGSHAEAAAITGATPAAIKLRAHRAYVALRRILQREKGGTS
jgi:DNA-directed RNA polymerase specialized sigma24 family protein